VALKSDTAAERSKDQLSRVFWGCSIFDFCNNIGQKQTIPQPRANLPEMSTQLLGRQIHPTFENDTYVVLPSPSEVAFANCEKVVERDVEIYRKKSQSIRMQSSASRTDIVADADAHFSPKEQQSFDLLSAHLQSNPRYVAALALVL
jgi:hypothetical protein